MPIFGWDASDFDWSRGPMDVGAARRAGIQFFTYKATEGTKTQHVHLGEAMARATAAGIDLRGAYIVVRTPGNAGHGSVQAQVDYFLAYLDGQVPGWRTDRGFFLQVDLEHWGYDDVAPQYGVEACGLLRARTGKWVVLYAPWWAYGDTIPGNDPLWSSSYGTNPALPHWQAYPGDGSGGWAPYSRRTPTIFQFGSRLQIGSQPTCDGNAFRGTIDQLRALVAGANPTPEVLDMPITTEDLEAIGNTVAGYAGAVGPSEPSKDAKLAMWVNAGWARVYAREARDAVADLAAKVDTIQAGVAPTQDQVDAAILKAMQDPAVINALGAAVASHIHVS